MTVVINGTTGITSVNGSAAAPSVTGTDTDTGIVYGTNTVTIATGGTAGLVQNSVQGVQIANTLGVGGTTPSTSGAGITFPATQSASTDANTLDDYEEGTWTPTIATTGTQPVVTSYETRSGKYTKIGNTVTLTCSVRALLSSAGTGSTIMTGIPFSVLEAYPSPAVGLRNLLNTLPVAYLGGSTLYLDGANWITGQNNYIAFTITYQAA